jgi:tetratricopeptide (TPR) repeat protein
MSERLDALREALRLRREREDEERGLVPAELGEPVPTAAGVRRRFAVGERIGSGGLGDVYLAEDRKIPGHLVAVKILRGTALTSPGAVERYGREARLLARVASAGCKGIAVPIDLGRDEGTGLVYIAMSRARGRPLHLIPDREITACVLDAWMLNAARALRDCHRAGVRHGDVKPSNILGETDGGVTLIDFGLAAALGPDAEVTGFTPEFEAPEQWRARREGDPGPVGPPSDLYAFGLVFRGLWDRWVRAGRRRRRIPRRVRDLLDACVRDDPAARPTAAGVEQGLLALAASRRAFPRKVAAAVGLAAALAVGLAHRRNLDLAAERDGLVLSGREARAESYEIALKPSATAVREYRLLGAPAGDRLADYRRQVEGFRKRAGPEPTQLDSLILLISDGQLALHEGRDAPAGLFDGKWPPVAWAHDPLWAADLHEVRGMVRRRAGDGAAAAREYEAAMAADPRRAMLHLRAAGAAALLGDDPGVLRGLSAFIDAGARGVGEAVRPRVLRDAHWARAAYRLVRADQPGGAYDDMREFFDRLGSTPAPPGADGLAVAHKTLAAAAYRLGKDDEAAGGFERSAALYSAAHPVPEDDDRLFLADCHSGVVLARTRADPRGALRAAAAAAALLPDDRRSRPFVTARARVALYRAIVLVRSGVSDQRVRARAEGLLADARQGYETYPTPSLNDDELYEYGLVFVMRAGTLTGRGELDDRIGSSRRGVALMFEASRRQPRFTPTCVPAALALADCLVSRATPDGGPAPADRAALAREAASVCERVGEALRGLPGGAIPAGELAFFRASQRLCWFRAARAAGDLPAAAGQARALTELCLEPGFRELVAGLPPDRLLSVSDGLGAVAEDVAGRYLLCPDAAGDRDACRALDAVSALGPDRASWRVLAAAAAARSRAGDYRLAAATQRRAIAAAPPEEVRPGLAAALSRYERGLPFAP